MIKEKAIKVEKIKGAIPLSEEKIARIKDEYIALNQQIVKKKEELAIINKNYKEEIKTLQESADTNLDIITTGTIIGEEDVYLVPNEEKGIMEYYLEDGTKIKEKPLKDKETELTLTGE